LVGSSLVASAFDFYENMRSDIPRTAIQQLKKIINTHMQILLRIYPNDLIYLKSTNAS
jgi:hypothetical protein